MFNKFGLDRFRKAQTTEPFQVDEIRASSASHANRIQQGMSSPQASLANAAGAIQQLTPPVVSYFNKHMPPAGAVLFDSSTTSLSSLRSPSPAGASSLGISASSQPAPASGSAGPSTNAHATTVGSGASTWQPPDWAVEPRPGVHSLEVSKEGQVVDTIPLDKKRTIFGRQQATCDFVLDHPSLSRQHAAVVHHKNGSVYVIDLGSVHGTFVSNERLLKDIPVEIEPGQSLRFAASSRTYILRKTIAAPPPAAAPVPDVPLPPPPDPADADAVLEYNTLMNRLGHPVEQAAGEVAVAENKDSKKRKRKDGESIPGFASRNKVRFRDEGGGILVEVVGYSDGFDVSTKPGPVLVKEGSSLVGKFDSIVQTVFIPRVKTKSTASSMESITSPTKLPATSLAGGAHIVKAPEKTGGISSQLREYLGKSLSKSKGLYGSLDEPSVTVAKQGWGKVEEANDLANGQTTERDGYGTGTSRDIVEAENEDYDMFGSRKL